MQRERSRKSRAAARVQLTSSISELEEARDRQPEANIHVSRCHCCMASIGRLPAQARTPSGGERGQVGPVDCVDCMYEAKNTGEKAVLCSSVPPKNVERERNMLGTIELSGSMSTAIP